jgi:uncharacterized protein YuzE
MKISRNLKAQGVFDYDYTNDILFFKINEREYSHSLELSDYIIDIDTKQFVVGLQVLNASKNFNISKDSLRLIKNWSLNTSINNGIIEVKVIFNMNIRNKIIEKSPIIIERASEYLPNLNMIARISS